MDVWGYLLLEQLRTLAAKQQVVPAQRGPAHVELLAACRHPFAILAAQPGDTDRRLAVAPALVAPAEGAVVAVPRRDRSLVELAENVGGHRLASLGGVDGVAKRGQLLH